MKKAKLPPQSIVEVDHSGWLLKNSKKGSSTKWIWSKRFFILKGNQLFYYKTQKSSHYSGLIHLTADTLVNYEDAKGRKGLVTIRIADRIYYLEADSTQEADRWLEYLIKAVSLLKEEHARQSTIASIRNRRETVPNKKSELRGLLSKTLDLPTSFDKLWHKWLDDLSENSDAASFFLSFSKNGDFSAEVIDYQYVLIQSMVDFFIGNGTAEIEIDYLNDVGTLLLPKRLGMWIAYRKKMNLVEGGWLVPDMHIPLNFYPKNSNIQLKIIETLSSVYEIQHFTRLKRNITRPDLYNEVSILLPEDWLSQPEKLVKTLQLLDFNLDLSHLVKLSAHHRTMLSISYDWEFVVQVSLVFDDPSEVWLNNFNQLHPDTGLLAKLQHTFVKDKHPVVVELKFSAEFEIVFHYKVHNLHDFA